MSDSLIFTVCITGPWNVSQRTITCEDVGAGDIFIHNNISAFWAKVRLLKLKFPSCLFSIPTFLFLTLMSVAD